jgi:hypothetical protein
MCGCSDTVKLPSRHRGLVQRETSRDVQRATRTQQRPPQMKLLTDLTTGERRHVMIADDVDRPRPIRVRWELVCATCGVSPYVNRPSRQCRCGAVDVTLRHVMPWRALTPQEQETIALYGPVL